MNRKKGLALILALMMLAALMPAVTPVWAESDWTLDSAPGAWDGPSTRFDGNDGSVTEIFDNGSMRTTYPDGRKEGLDNQGNRFEEMKNGTLHVYAPDGVIGVKYPDGSGVVTAPNGSGAIYNTDGSHTEYDSETGITKSFDKDDNWVSMTSDSGETIQIYDENGDTIRGEQSITDKNGDTYTWKCDSAPDGAGGEKIKEMSVTITDKQGNEISHANFHKDENGIALDIKSDDGTVKYTSDGLGGDYEMTVTNSDGTHFTSQKTDENGLVTSIEKIDDNIRGHMHSTFTEDKDGNTVDSNIDIDWTDDDGTNMKMSGDGSNLDSTVTSKDGTKMETTISEGDDGIITVKERHTYKDGSTLETTISGRDDIINSREDKFTDKDGNEQDVTGKKFKNANGSVTEFGKDGTVKVTDKDGGKIEYGTDGVKFISGDGSTEWETTYSGEIKKYMKEGGLGFYVDPNTGEQVFLSPDRGIEMRVVMGSDGEPIEGTIKGKDGFFIKVKNGELLEYSDPEHGLYANRNDDGTFTVKNPNGTGGIYGPDENGKFVLLKGEHDDEGFGDTSDDETPQPAEEIIDADGDGMPEQVNLTDRGTPIPTENIEGAYVNAGNSYYYGVNSDWKDVWITASADTVIEVSITGENTFCIYNSATGKESPIDLTYDPATGRAHGEYQPEGIKVPAVYDAAFTELKDGRISLNIITNWGDTPMLAFHGIK